MRHFIAILGVGALGMVASVQAGTWRDDLSEGPFLDLAADPLYQSVGRINFSIGGNSYLASGVLISPDWVLTAAHVVGGNDYLGGGISNLNFSFTVGSSVTTFAAAEWFTHPGWATTAGDFAAGYDLGLLHLGQSVSGVEAAALYPSDSLNIQPGTLVGYGETGTGLTGSVLGTAGFKHAGENMIDAQGDGVTISSNLLFVDFDQPGTDANNVTGGDVPLPMEYMIAPGDSGGGLFITENNQTFLVGIASFRWGILDGMADSTYGDVAGFTSVTSQLDWISSITGVPEPSSQWLVGLALVGWGFLRGSRSRRTRMEE